MGGDAVRTPSSELFRAISSGLVPGAVFAAGRAGTIEEVAVAGVAGVSRGVAREVQRDTLFDLASLTKVVVAAAVLVLVEGSRLDLDDAVRRFIPSFVGEGRDRVSLRQLLSHNSGLPGEYRFYAQCTSVDEALALLERFPLKYPPGEHTEYSDLGFMLIGRILETVAGIPLDRLVSDLVLQPLDMQSTMFRPPLEVRDRVAATSNEPAGTVHDSNSRFFGGVSGHAGLFSSVDDLVKFAGAWLSDDDVPFLSASLLANAFANHTAASGGRRGLAWVRRGDPADFLCERWSHSALSHTGFTGTSLAIDPCCDAFAVLLTNFVYFEKERSNIRSLRERVHRSWGPLGPGSAIGNAPQD